MRFTRPRVIASMLAVSCAAAGGGAVIAQGQGPAVPAPPTGTLEFELVIDFRGNNIGINTASGRAPRGQFPRPADLAVSRGTVRQNGQRVGRYFLFNTGAAPARNRRGRGWVAIGSVVVDFGGGNQLNLGDAIVTREGNVTGPVVGGTGRFAGARGVATSRARQTRTQLVQTTTVQFMP